MRFDIAHMHSVYTHFSKETTWGFVEESMEHWMIVVSPTDRLLHGAPLFKTARPYYGGLTTLLAVAIQRVWGEFSLRGYCTYFAFLQAICLVLAARVYYVFTGRRWALCLLPLVFAGCNFHFNTSLEYPEPYGLAFCRISRSGLDPRAAETHDNPGVCFRLGMHIVARPNQQCRDRGRDHGR